MCLLVKKASSFKYFLFLIVMLLHSPISTLSFPKIKTYVNDIFVRRLYVIFFIIRLNRILDGQLDVSKLCVKKTYTCWTFINCIEIFTKIPNKIEPFPSYAKIFQRFNKCQIWSLFMGVKINIFIHSVIPKYLQQTSDLRY